MRRFTAASILAAVLLALTVTPASAGDEFKGDTEMSGQATCNTADGTYVIVWTFQFVSNGDQVEIESAATTGAIVEPVSLSPTTLLTGQTATGTTVAPGSTSGTVGLTVKLQNFNGISLTNEVVLDGSCVAAAPAAAVPAAPTFTG